MQKLEGEAFFVIVSVRALLAAVIVAPLGAQMTERVSLDSSGAQGNSSSRETSISADGRYVAFESLATNLVSGDTNGFRDILVRDRQSFTTERVSLDSSGTQGNGDSFEPAISGDGRYVAFRSGATDLVGGDTNGFMDIFVHDRQSGTIERISLDSSGTQGNGDSFAPAISGDGRYVAFESVATNLVGGDTNAFRDVFVRDRLSGTTELVSLASGGAQGDELSLAPSISADGRYVAFQSGATNFSIGGFWWWQDVFVRDRQSGTTERVSVDSSGAPGNDHSLAPSISADGRYVAFESLAFNLVLNDSNSARDIFVHDRQNGTTERVNLDSSGTQADFGKDSFAPSISADGRYVAFDSTADNLVGWDPLGQDAFVRDRQSDTTERVSLDSNGTPTTGGGSFEPSISGDGRYVSFWSYAPNLVGGDSNGVEDIFLRDRDAPGFTSSCHPGFGGVIGCPCGQPWNPTGGCANHGAGATSGAVLGASGVAYVSADTLMLTTSNHRSPAVGVLNVFFSFKPGTVTSGAASGAGVRCTSGGDLKRLYTMQVFGGSGSKPGMGDPSISARSAALPGHAIAPPDTRYYFTVYRDGQASLPCGSTAVSTNLTNMGSISWGP